MNTPVWNTIRNVSAARQSTALKWPNLSAATLALVTGLSPYPLPHNLSLNF